MTPTGTLHDCRPPFPAAAVKGLFNGALGSVHVGNAGVGGHGKGVARGNVPVRQQAEGVNVVIPAGATGPSRLAGAAHVRSGCVVNAAVGEVAGEVQLLAPGKFLADVAVQGEHEGSLFIRE